MPIQYTCIVHTHLASTARRKRNDVFKKVKKLFLIFKYLIGCGEIHSRWTKEWYDDDGGVNSYMCTEMGELYNSRFVLCIKKMHLQMMNFYKVRRFFFYTIFFNTFYRVRDEKSRQQE